MRLLVAGEDRVDAGKTTFSVGLLARLEGTGRDPTGFKPRAGNDFWFDHDDVCAAVDGGRLYGKDVSRLADVDARDWPVEVRNPVHRLWRPTPGRSGMLGESGRTFLVDRVTTPEGSRFVLNRVAAEAGLIPESLTRSLPLSGATRVRDLQEFNDVMAGTYLPGLSAVGERVRESATAVVESYGDIATPLEDVEFDAVATVAPGRVRVFDGERYLRARAVARGSAREGRLEERVGNVVDMVDPMASVELPALAGEKRGDPRAVASAYEPAYDALLEAV